MPKDFHLRLIAVSIFVTLLLGLAMPLAALAQEGDTPTPTLESSPTETASPENSPTPEASATEVPSETPTLEISPTSTETAGSETPSEMPSETPTPTVTGSVTETPTPTITPTLDEPLTVSAITSASVIYCPATVASPVESAMGCTAAFTSLSLLFAAVDTLDPNVDGTIWIGKDYSNATAAVLDGDLTTNMDLRKVTFKGGWIGTGGTIDNGSPSTIGHRIQILDWQHDVAMNNFLVTGASGGFAIDVTTSKSITLTRVSANSNSHGISLDNTDGGTGTGNISITTGTFNSNSSAQGVFVQSRGTITISGVTVSDNSFQGATFGNPLAPTDLPVTITNSTFNDNDASSGLFVLSRGNITLTNVFASLNSGLGADLESTYGLGTISITNSQFSSNTFGGGLLALADNTITLNSVTASANLNGDGVSIDNTTAASAKSVVVTGVNEFSSNRSHGLLVITKGSVSLKDVAASGNGILGTGGSGVVIDNTYGANPGPGVTLTGTNIFTANYTNGAEIASYGPISANNVIANSNLNQYGFWVYNNGASTAQPITVTGSNLFNFNELGGLIAYSNGLITLNNLTATNTANGSGAYVENHNVGYSSGIKVNGTNSFLENSNHGLWLLSNGPISANNITADDNGQGASVGYGLAMNNSFTATTMQNITLTGVNSINRNYWTNLYATSKGSVSLASITASGSDTGAGILVDNTNSSDVTLNNSKKPVTISGTNVLSENYGSGLEVTSYGLITTNNITANENGLTGGATYGVNLLNSAAATAQSVTMNGVNVINGNGPGGLGVTTAGAFKANSVTASNNGAAFTEDGVTINNIGTLGVAAVTFTGTNVFNNNAENGLFVNSSGVVSLNNVTASENDSTYGVNVTNTFSGSSNPKAVSVTGTNVFNNNEQSGIYIASFGDISLSNTTATGNGAGGVFGAGASLFNATSLTPKKITVSGINNFSSNFNLGLLGMSDGLITVNSASAGSNGDGGVWLQNDDSGNTAGVTLTGSSNYSLNDGPGLSIYSRGPVSAINLNSIANIGADGAIINNYQSATPQLVRITGTNTFSSNGDYGLNIVTKGAVTLNNISASANLTLDGVYVDQTSSGSPTSPQAFTLTGASTISQNTSGNGLFVTSYGAISISRLTASGNAGAGASLNNETSSAAQKVAFAGANVFNDNDAGGLAVSSKGLITSATSLTANGNSGSYGIALDNRGPGGLGGTGAVTLSGTTTANTNATSGLVVLSHGIITVTNVTATENGTGVAGYGARLENWDVSTPVDVKLNGTNKFSGNHQAGLYVSTDGAITGNSITASETTDGYGAFFEGFTEGKAFTLTGSNYFNSNYTSGLLIQSYGVVTINNLNASLNGFSLAGSGASIDNTLATTPRNITLTGTNLFIGNDDSGLILNSDGAVSISNLRAHANGQLGASIANGTGTAGVTLSGINSFRNNDSTGLYISSQGAVTVNKATADGNDQDGLHIDSTPDNITLMCGFFTNNLGDGVDVNTPAIFKRVGVVASGNSLLDIRFTGGGTEVVVRNCP